MSGLGTNNPFRKRASMPPRMPASQPKHAADPSAPSLFDSYTSPLSEGSAHSTFRTSSGTAVDSSDDNTGTSNAVVEDGPISPRKSERPDPPQRSFKKVQIQTPPPLSPSSPEDSSTSCSEDESAKGPFSRKQISQDWQVPVAGLSHTQAKLDETDGSKPSQPSPAGPLHNPFAKTLHDIEHGGKEEDEKNSSRSGPPRASMDVDAFKRLLLTGYAGLEGHGRNAEAPTAAALSPQVSTDSVETFRAKSQTTTRLQPPESASTTDASRQSSLFDTIPESPSAATPHEPEEEGPLAASPAPPRKKQPPPAPASRHGKLIKMELGKDQAPGERPVGEPGTDAADRTAPKLHRSPSDINKPLPPQPIPVIFDDSPFDREAAGKLPEPVEKEPHVAMLQTPSSDLVATTPADGAAAKPQPPSTRKAPAPVPPPRRHARGESKVLTASLGNTIHSSPSPSPMMEDSQQPIFPAARRASGESTRSTAKAYAPAPPPPRRPHHQSRPSVNSMPLVSPGYLGSPSTVSLPSPHANTAQDAASIYSVASEAPPIPPHSKQGALSPTHSRTFPIIHSSSPTSPGAANGARDPLVAKLSPPPPPPTRNPSTRRAPSVSSFDLGAVPRKTSREGVTPPPPPPKRGTRNRGDSRGSDTAGVSRRESIDIRDTVPEETGSTVGVDGETITGKADGVSVAIEGGKSHAKEILADLVALQREVDALRGRYEQVGNTVGGGVHEMKSPRKLDM